MVTVRLGFIRSDGTSVLYVSWWWGNPTIFIAMPEFQEWSRRNPRYFRLNTIVRYGAW